MGSLRLCMAAMLGRVTFLRVLVEAPRGEWEECRMVGCVGLCAAYWTLGRLRHLFKTTVQAREGAVAESVVGIVAALNNKARDMFALILGLAMVDYVVLNVNISMGGRI